MTTGVSTISAAGNAAVLNVQGDNTATLHVVGGTTNATGVNLTFEASIDSNTGSDGTWFAVSAARTNSSTVESATGALALNTGVGNGYGWRVNVSNYKFLRARATAITAGNVVATIVADVPAFDPAPAVGTHAVTQSGNWTMQTNAASAFNVVTTASTNLSAQVATASNLFELTVSNPTATAVFVKVYNKASAPTLASDVPVMTIPVPAGSIQELNFGTTGKRFASGIALAVTAAAASTDATAAVAGVVVNGTRV